MTFKKAIILISSVLVVVLIGAGLFLYNYNFSEKVNVERTAVVFTLNDSSSAKSTSIKVNGTLYKPLFRQNKFIGTFTIDAYDFTKDQDVNLFITQRNKDINMGSLFYLDPSPPHNIKQYGLIWFDDKFENINIWPSTTWIELKDKNPAFIATGSNYEQATENQILLRKKFGETFVPHEYDYVVK